MGGGRGGAGGGYELDAHGDEELEADFGLELVGAAGAGELDGAVDVRAPGVFAVFGGGDVLEEKVRESPCSANGGKGE